MEAIKLLLLLLFVSCVVSFTPIPNIGYLGAGYDILKGNPHSTSPEQGVDPGYQAFIFDLSVFNSSSTPDHRYAVPFGVDALLCDFCSINTESEVITGTQSYEEDVSREIGGKIGGYGLSFGASKDYKKISQGSSSYRNVFMETKAECCAYKSQISQYLPPALSAEFIAAVKSLPRAYNEASYMKFLNYFGTHAVTSMMMGGRYGMRTTFSSQTWSQLQSSTIDKKASAGFSLYHVSAAANAMTETQKKMAANYDRFVETREMFIVGGEVPADGSVASWAQNAAKNPMPLTITVVPIADILHPDYFPKNYNLTDLALKQTILNTALTNYCNWMKAQGQIAQCVSPGPDPPAPLGSAFGGFYQSDDCNKDNVVNSFTNGMSCPNGFTQHMIGRALGTSGCGVNQFVCLANGQASDPLDNYGGGYQVGDVATNVKNNYVNPFTGGMNCPTGYTPVNTGRVIGPETKQGANQFSCLNTGHVPTYESTGGFYQITDENSAEDRIVNYFTQAPSCPPNFCAVQYGRVKEPEGKQFGATQTVCIACNLIHLF